MDFGISANVVRVYFVREQPNPRFLRRPALALPCILAVLFAPLARGDGIEYQINSINAYTDLVRGAAWMGGVNNNWTTNTLAVDEGICLSVVNNNTTSSHTVTIQVFNTLDSRLTTYLPNASKWGQSFLFQNGGVQVSGPGQVATPVTIPEAGLVGLYVRTGGAARMSFGFTGASGAAGSPDTMDAYITHNVVGGACGNALTPSQVDIKTVSEIPVTSHTGGIPIEIQQTTAASASWTSATPLNTALTVNSSGFSNSTVSVHVTGSITGGSLNFETSDDGTTFYSVTCFPTGGGTVTFLNSQPTYAIATGAAMFNCPNYGDVQFRVRLNPAIVGAGTAIVNITNSALPAQTNTVQSVLSAQTSIAFSTSPFDNAGANVTTAVSVKNAQANLYGWYVVNTTAALCYLQIFNNNAPTLGTTVPALTLGIPANGGANQALSIPIGFSTAMAVAATTTPAGAATCAMTVNIWFD